MSSLEVKRQLIHASGVLIALFIGWLHDFSGGWVAPSLVLAFAILGGYGVSYIYRRGVNLPILTNVISGSERESDKEFPGRGAIRFFTGALITLIIFRMHPEIVVAGILVLALGDSTSTLVGVSYGRHKIFYNQDKSIEGSLAGIVAGAIGIWILTPFTLFFSIVASFVGMVTESLPIDVDDNLTVPVLTGLTLYILKILVR